MLKRILEALARPFRAKEPKTTGNDWRRQPMEA